MDILRDVLALAFVVPHLQSGLDTLLWKLHAVKLAKVAKVEVVSVFLFALTIDAQLILLIV